MRTLALLLTMMLPFGHREEAPAFPSINTMLSLRWKTHIGVTTHRSNMIMTADRLYIGSNGNSYMDYWLNDQPSGVYAIDRRTGKKIWHFGNEVIGDMDVNGLLLHDNKIYFGNDNEEFLCTDLEGNILWRNAASGDIEHEAVLINMQGKNAVVYATERGQVTAVDPSNGKHLWNYFVAGYDGWKPGDNRMVFKVKAHFYETRHFFVRPYVYDLNRDGIQDIVYGDFNDSLIAINGLNGKQLWKIDNVADGVFTGVLTKQDGEQLLSVMNYERVNDESGRYKEYLISSNGKIKSSISVGKTFRYSSLNALTTRQNERVYASFDSVFIMGKNGYTTIDRTSIIEDKYRDTIWSPKYRNSRDVSLGNRTFPFGGEPECMMILNQHDNGRSYDSFIEIISLSSGKVLHRLGIERGGEFIPIIDDIDRDGKLDLLISCYDGWLYCYKLEAPKKKNI